MESPQHHIAGTQPQLDRHKAMLHSRKKAMERDSQVYRERGCLTWDIHTPTAADDLRKPVILLNIQLLIDECGFVANRSHMVHVVYICKHVCICVCVYMLVCIHVCMYVYLVCTCELYLCMWRGSVCTGVMFMLHVCYAHSSMCSVCVCVICGGVVHSCWAWRHTFILRTLSHCQAGHLTSSLLRALLSLRLLTVLNLSRFWTSEDPWNH